MAPLLVSQGFPSSTMASVHIYGVPDQIVEGLIGGGKVAGLLSLNLGHGWVSGDQFQRSLVGRIVYSGNAYIIRDSNPTYNSSNPREPNDILQEGGVRFPLRVIETHQDVHLVFARDGLQFRTELGENQEKYNQSVLVWQDRTGAVPYYRFIGSYVLENGVMVSNGNGGWVPAPTSTNALLRTNGEEIPVSLVIVYSFPFE